MSEFKFELGEEVKDKVTGFTGVVMCQSRYLTGCLRYSIMSKKLTKENKPADWVAYDEDQLESLHKNINHKIVKSAGPQRFEAERR